ncbi:MAG TPA: DNA cytosine methyltransferase, partial [Coleofasciculaceae cyanobacterium]
SWDNRRFTVAELKRLQTIPDYYEIVGNRQVTIEQIGNSVPPQLARILALSILNQVIGIQLPFFMHYLSKDKKLGFRQRKRQLTQAYLKKAQTAILNLQSLGKLNSTLNINYKIKEDNVKFLSADFAWTDEAKTESLKVYLSYDLNASYWLINAGKRTRLEEESQFVIDVHPSCGEAWGLGTDCVKLCAEDFDLRVVTALWKAFEEKVTEMTGKADLVQLSGYYQYKARITGIMTFNPQLKIDSLWHVVQCVTKGIGTVTQLSGEELAELWSVSAENIFSYLQSLRRIGYEVRNHNTNSQLPKGTYLIPYLFPTLNPKSIQLRRSL